MADVAKVAIVLPGFELKVRDIAFLNLCPSKSPRILSVILCISRNDGKERAKAD